MNLSPALKKLYKKVGIFSSIFIVILSLYLFLFYFYSKNLIKKIEKINALKDQYYQSQISIEKENKLKRLTTIIQQKTKKELPALLYDIQQKLNHNFETTKKLILDKIQKENWQIKSANFYQEENKVNIVFQIPSDDFKKFYDFMINSGLVWQIIKLNLNQNESLIEIDLTLQTK